MDKDKGIVSLVKKAVKDKVVYVEDVVMHTTKDYDLYRQIEHMLLDRDNDIIPIEEIDDVSGEDAEVEEAEEEEVEPDDLSLSGLEVEEVELVKIETIASSDTTDDLVRMYLKEIGRIPLLNREQERAYAMQVSSGRYAKEQLAEIESGTLDLKDSDIKELEQTISRAKQAKDRLIEANYRLVVSIAKRHIGRGLPFLDLIQEGSMGLMRAVDKFDYEKGFKFSTYATWWIRQAITRGVADKGRTIRLPVHMVETINKMNRIKRQLNQEYGREPTIQEIADKMGITPGKVRNIQRIAKEPISLETGVGDDDGSSIGDFISDPEGSDPHGTMMKNWAIEILDDVLKTLTEREEKVLRLRSGLFDGKTYTLEEVGREFGVTRERIRQIEAKAMRKLQSPSNLNRLREAFDV